MTGTHEEKAAGGPAIVLITGASSGLGAALTRELDASLPDDITFWLVARQADKLEAFATTLDHESRCLALDLTLEESFLNLRAHLEGAQPRIQLLVNNAGEGRTGPFCSLGTSAPDRLCDLNIRAQVSMTSLALPYMAAGSAILFTASVAAFLPQPGFAAYAASKAFILSFGRALREELKKDQIRVTVTCPNPMLTDFFAREDKEKILGSYKRLGLEDPGRVAQKTLAAMRRNRGVVVTSPAGKLIRLAAKLLPVTWLIRLIPWS